MRLFSSALCIAVLTAGSLLSSVALAQTPKIQPPPPLEKIDLDVLPVAARAAMACGAGYLVRSEETNQCGFLYPPLFRSNVVSYKGFKEIELRYRKVEKPVMRPIYENYETFEVASGASGADARNLRKVTKRRIVGYEKVGTKTEDRLVRDKDGPIVQKHKVPIDPVWERKTIWPDGLLGMNGMAMYLLLKCGYYEKTNILQVVARNLANHMEYNGLPDMTWDVAWLAAAFANIPEDKFDVTRDRLINKLLDGQIVEGASRGLWGPVCIRAETLAAMIAYEQTLGKTMDKAKGKAQGKAKAKIAGKANLELANETEEILKDFQTRYLLYAQQGTRFEEVTANFLFGSSEDRITMLGLPYYIYDQAVADMESTSLALFAIREASERKCLPAKTVKPLGARKRTLLEGETVSTIMARAAAAVAGMQKTDGSWDECNIHQAIGTFVPLGFPARPAENVLQLASPQTQLASLQAFAALLDVGYIAGYDKLLGRFRRNVESGYADAVAKLQAFLENPGKKDGVGRLLPPYDLTGKSGAVLRGGALLGENRRDLWLRLASLLVNLQNDDGSWKASDTVMLSSGLLAHFDEAHRRAHEKQMEKKDQAQRTPYNPARERARLRTQGIRLLQGDYLATCFSMLALLDGIREPLIGFYSDKPAAGYPLVMGAAVEALGRGVDLPAPVLRVTDKTQVGIVLRLPVLLVDGSGLPADPAAKALLAGYASGSGFMVIEKPAAADAGWENNWASVVGGKAGNVPENFSFLKELNFKVALRGLYGATGQLVGVFLPQARGQGDQVVSVLAAIIKSYSDSAYFERDFPIRIKGFSGEPFVARIALLDQLNLAARAVPQQLPDRAAPLDPDAAAPAVAAPAAVPAPAPKPQAEDDQYETSESGVPLPKIKSADKLKSDEVW